MKKVCIDPGHYGSRYNQSTEVPAYYESEMAWKLHLYLKDAMESKGFQVITTREKQEEDLAVYQRGEVAKSCDLFLSLHSNACGTESVDYPVVYYAFDNLNGSKTVAEDLAGVIAKEMGTTQGGKAAVRSTSSGTEYYGVMRGARAVGCPLYLLLEHSFHTNKQASLWLLEESHLKALAEKEASFFAEYFQMEEEDTSAYTSIMGEAKITEGQMKAYLQSVCPDGEEYLPIIGYYLEEGKREGVRGDIAFAQACLETGNFQFGGDVLPQQNNFCGLGATGNGEPGLSFSTMELGVRAQIQHLQAYACCEPLVLTCIDPRYKYVTRGSSPYVEWLGIQENPNGIGWASGADYGEKILAIMKKMEVVEVKEETKEEVPVWMQEAVSWMTEEGFMVGDLTGDLGLNRDLTRGEFAVMLLAYHKKYSK